ncbi:MAG: fumarylacetoacetate hydrolase family protein [Pseudomonadota bacterium]
MSATDLAQQLATARIDRTQIDPQLLEGLQDEAQAYQLQQLVGECYGSLQIGYKVGATNETSQKMFGCDSPFFGPMFERDCHDTGAVMESHAGLLGGEAEFAFVIDRDVPTDTNLSTDQLATYVRAVHVAVELVGRRSAGTGLPPLFAAIADFGGNAAFISGPAIRDWQSIDLAAVSVTALTNRKETNAGSGAAVLGHPLNSLLWLHDTLRQRGTGLREGQWITTGTCLGVIKPVADSTVEIDFAGCGQISYRLT